MSEKMTGYPSIDKPWSKLYKKNPSKDIEKYQRLYELIFHSNEMDAEALGFLDGDCTWTFRKLKNQTDKCMAALIKQGIQEGDTVLMGVTNTPEMVAAVIAIVSIGASVKFFDIRASEKDIQKYAELDNCKYAIALDQIVLPKIDAVLEDTPIEKVFVLRPQNSLSLIEKVKYAIKHKVKISEIKTEPLPADGKHFELSSVIKEGKEENACLCEYKENSPAFKVQSSGTTGKAKTVVHPEKSAVEFAKIFAYMDLPVSKGKTILVALPPWIAYGLGNAIIMPLALGAKVDLCADFEPDAVYRNIGRFTLSFAAPFHYRFIRDHYDEMGNRKKKNLAKVDCMVTGGDKYSAAENEKDEETFGTVIINGYGNNEAWGSLTANPVNANRYGSVGIPKYGEVTIIYDNENEKELKYGEIGEICSLSRTCFLEYQDNPEATAVSLRMHSDGKQWLHTGDLGYMDDDGYIFISGRKERVITRLGFKLSAYTIEDAITSISFISECVTVEAPDKVEEHVPMSFVVKSGNCEISTDEIIMKVKEECKRLLKENEIPKYIIVEDELKYTDNNKYDFRYYEKKAREYVQSVSTIE